jgi:hypothetical protein
LARTRARESLTRALVKHARGRASLTRALVKHARGRASLTRALVKHARARASLTRALVKHARGRASLTRALVKHARGRASLTRALVKHARARASLTRALVKHARARASLTRALVKHARARASLTRALVKHARARASLTWGAREACGSADLADAVARQPRPGAVGDGGVDGADSNDPAQAACRVCAIVSPPAASGASRGSAMKSIASCLGAFGTLVALATMSGCGGSIADTRHADGQGGQDAALPNEASSPPTTGAVEVKIPAGVSADFLVASVHYTLSNGAHSYSGTVMFTPALEVSFLIASVAPGAGYSLDADVTFAKGFDCPGFSDSVDVSAGQAATMVLQPQCISTGPPPNMADCAVWNTIVADPPSASLLPPDDTIALRATATAPDLAAITFTWSVTAGTGTISQNRIVPGPDMGMTGLATFTCPQQSETDTIQLVVDDGPIPNGDSCPPSYTTGTVSVTCAAAPLDAGPDAVAEAGADGESE